MSPEAGAFFEKVTRGLDAAGVKWTRNPYLVRGLDYYRHTAFEFVTDRLGAQGTVLGGGRYDGLIETLGGPHTPAVGWAAGIERLAMLIDAPAQNRDFVALVVENDALQEDAVRAAAALRRADIAVEIVASGSPRKRYDRAMKLSPGAVLSLDQRDGENVRRFKDLGGNVGDVEGVLASLA
jgi:histidyl-tRNA synthetase